MNTGAARKFREQYRREEIGPRYSGRGHFAFTTLVCLAVILLSASRADGISALEWLTVPAIFLYANLVEYWGHRVPMHRPVRGLGIIYRRHAGQHHRFFTHENMDYDDARDFKAVLFPPVMILFFMGGMALPLWLVLYFFATPNVAWLAIATAFAYFLNYEWLHWAYHCSAGSRVGRLPGVQLLRGLHRDHHDPMLMARCNFNITYPIGDWLFGTRYRAPGSLGD